MSSCTILFLILKQESSGLRTRLYICPLHSELLRLLDQRTLLKYKQDIGHLGKTPHLRTVNSRSIYDKINMTDSATPSFISRGELNPGRASALVAGPGEYAEFLIAGANSAPGQKRHIQNAKPNPLPTPCFLDISFYQKLQSKLPVSITIINNYWQSTNTEAAYHSLPI